MYYIMVSIFVLELVAGVEQVANDVLHCQPVTSCSNRCNIDNEARQYYDPSVGGFVIPSYTCFCDPLCRLYGDCCVDYDSFCANAGDKVKEIQMQVGQPNYSDPQEKLDTVDPQKEVPPPPHDSRSMFECITIKEYPHRPFWSTSKCHHSWVNSEVAKLCSNITEADLLSRLPVQSDDGLTYRNVFCAQCNGRVNVTFWRTDARCRNVPPGTIDPDSLARYLKEDCVTFFTTERESPPRYCLSVENTCDHSNHGKNFTKLSKACVDGYQSPVVGHKTGGSSKIFKNSYCAECNGVEIQREYCPNSRSKNIDNIDEYGKYLSDKFDYQYSVITNFNTRDSDHLIIMYRSSGNVIPVEIHCPDGKVYDPYSEACREIYCGDSYMLVGDECVEDRRPPQDVIKCSTPSCDNYPTIPNDGMVNNITEVTFRLTIVVRFEITLSETDLTFDNFNYLQLLDDNFNVSVKNITIDNENVYTTWKSFNHSSTSNSTLEVTKTNVTVSGTAIVYVTQTAARREDLDVAIVAILGSLARSVDIYDVTIYVDSTVVEFPNKDHNNVELDLDGFSSFLQECKTGVVRIYCANDVTYMSQNGCVSVFVNTTETEYSCTDSYIYNNENVSDTSYKNYTVFVCDHVYQMDDSCSRVRYNETEYMIWDDGSVHVVDGSIYEKGDYIKVDDGQVEVCTELKKVQHVYYVVFFDFNNVQKCIAFVCISVSIVGLFLTIVTYSLLTELRTLPGKCIISLASTTLASQFIFLIGINTDDSMLCTTVAMLLHYLFLSSSLWTNVMAYDVYKTFGKKQIFLRERKPKSTYRKYCVYAWGIPFGIVLVCVVLYFSNLGLLGYGTHYSCWISRALGFLVAFLVPLIIILLMNFALFAKTVYAMRVNRRSTHLDRESRAMPSDRSELTVYIKMSTVMGFAWVFGCIAAFTDTDALWYFFIIFNGLQGLFIYVSFACNARVRKLIRNKYAKYKKSKQASADSTKPKVRFTESVQSSTISKSLSVTEMEMHEFAASLEMDCDLQPSDMMSNC